MDFILRLGAIFQMWRETRRRQMAQFQNVAIDSSHQIEGHGANAVTPEQVYFVSHDRDLNVQIFIFTFSKFHISAFCLPRGQPYYRSKLIR